MKNKGQILALAAVAALMGCGGSGVDSSPKANFAPGIYIGDYGNDRLVRINDMSGSGWEENADNFGQITGITFSKQGRIMISMSNPEQVVQMDDMAGKNRRQFHGEGLGILMFSNLTGVHYDSTGRLLVVDGYEKQRIVRLDNLDDTTAEILDLSPYYEGPNEQFHAVIDSQDRIYAIFRNSGKLLLFDSFEDSEPQIVGGTGTGTMQFQEPVDLHLDAQGRIYVAEYKGHRIVRFDDMQGTNWTTLGTDGTGDGQFKNPTCIETDSMGRIYVGDGVRNQIIRMDDMTGAGWVALGSYGSGPGQFYAPWEITIRE
jgi:streptogramin lyase